jgi:hypothetical protein
MQFGTRIDTYSKLCWELETFVTPRLLPNERIVTDLCIAVGPRRRLAPFSLIPARLALATPWSRRSALVVTSQRVILVERATHRPHRLRRIARQAPRYAVRLVKYKEGRKGAAFELAWEKKKVRLYVDRQFVFAVPVVRMTLASPPTPTAPMAASVSPIAAQRRAKEKSRKRRSRRPEPTRELVLDDAAHGAAGQDVRTDALPLHMRADWRRTVPAPENSLPGSSPVLPREIVRDDLPLHMRVDWRRAAAEETTLEQDERLDG